MAQAVGSEIYFPEVGIDRVIKPVLEDYDQLKTLMKDNPKKNPVFLSVLQRGIDLKAAFPEMGIAMPVAGPFTNASCIRPVEKILRDFGLNPASSKVINGHVPVKIKDGESPRKADGLLYIIDGGISKAYQKTTGIAGYTFIYNSHSMALAEHKPYTPKNEDGTQEFHSPKIMVVEHLKERELIRDTDKGKELMAQIADLKELVNAYRNGTVKQL
jgi:fructose-1,6-bisphosphatase-3